MAACRKNSVVLLLVAMLVKDLMAEQSHCASFEFPDVTGDAVTREENSTLDLYFELKGLESCPEKNITITVNKQFDGKPGTVCSLRLQSDGTCTRHDVLCKCPDRGNRYKLTTTVDRDDNGSWWWTTNNKAADARKIDFIITYKVRLNNMQIVNLNNTTPVDPGTDGDVVCILDSGKLPATARLLDRHGVEMNIKTEQGQIRYHYDNIRCQDAGIIRCEAPGASQNLSTTLLVRCPPEMTLPQNEITVRPGENVHLNVNVRSYTRNITQCQIRKEFHSGTSRGPVKCDLANLMGDPPDLTLTVHIDNIQEDEAGVWILTMANDAGEAEELEIQLKVDTGSVTLVVIIASAVAALVAVVGFIVVAVLMARRLSSGSHGSRKSCGVMRQTRRELVIDLPASQPTTPALPPRSYSVERLTKGPAGQSDRHVPDGLDEPGDGEYTEINVGGIQRGAGAVTAATGPRETYTDVVDQLSSLQAQCGAKPSDPYYAPTYDDVDKQRDKGGAGPGFKR